MPLTVCPFSSPFVPVKSMDLGSAAGSISKVDTESAFSFVSIVRMFSLITYLTAALARSASGTFIAISFLLLESTARNDHQTLGADPKPCACDSLGLPERDKGIVQGGAGSGERREVTRQRCRNQGGPRAR